MPTKAVRTLAHIFSLFALALSPRISHAEDRDEAIRKRLSEFENNTAEFMNRVPEKSGMENPAQHLPRLGEGVSKYDLINRQIDRLKGQMGGLEVSRARLEVPFPYGEEDRAEDLVDELRHRTLESMESSQLTSSQLEQQPWSGTYWPIAKGVIAWRYADKSFPDSPDWKVNADFLLNPRNSCSVEQLSPAEKYDLLVGDSKRTLTQVMIDEGKGYYDIYGNVESWMGICHGWAPASYMAPRPTHTVDVMARDGHTLIRFYPSDLKALASLLWANGSFKNRFIGQRCQDKKPPVDENGRIMDPACYGENPGTWHLAVVNQIGVARRSFVMDALHDTEIWNQPVYGYRYTYFNPQSRQPVKALIEAEVPIADFTQDKFKRYRSPKARSVVGVAMDLTYIAEKAPSTDATDAPKEDQKITVHYLYDLELGEDREVLGGEWYSNAHPGFLWTPTPDARAMSVGDTQLSDDDSGWDGETPLPGEWASAIRSSARRGQPLARIVEALGVLAKLRN